MMKLNTKIDRTADFNNTKNRHCRDPGNHTFFIPKSRWNGPRLHNMTTYQKPERKQPYRAKKNKKGFLYLKKKSPICFMS